MKPHSQRCITKSDIDTAAVRAIFHCLIKTKHHGYQSSPCQAGPGGKFSVYIFIMCPLSPEPASSPHAGVEWPGGRAAPSPSGQKRPKVVAPSPRTSRPPAGPPATTSLSPRPLFRGRQRSEAVTGPRLRVRRVDRGRERRATTIGASRGSFRFFPRHGGGKGGSGKECGPPRASGWGAGHSRSPGAAAPCSGPVVLCRISFRVRGRLVWGDVFQSDSQKAGSLRRSHCPGGGVRGVLPRTPTPPPTASVPVVNSVQRSGLHHASHWPQRQGTRGRLSAKWEHGFTRPGWA